MTQPATVRIRVPASSANLGPGYDSFGLALGRWDEVVAGRRDSGLQVTVSGVGADTVPADESHLVYQAARTAFGVMGESVPGLRLDCVNTIPHGGGQGSSAAAIVAGILAARALTPGGVDRLNDDAVFAVATEMEGHPDNVAPVLFGGFTVSWMTEFAGARHPRAVRLVPHPDVRAVIMSAHDSCFTEQARAVLPPMVPHADAAANSARSALLVHAMTTEPALLLDATADWLHQRYREEVMPHTAALLHRLRSAGVAATLSGAGPSILVVGTDLSALMDEDPPGFEAIPVTIPTHGATIDGQPWNRADAPNVAISGSSPVA